jgi:hypothetical protein
VVRRGKDGGRASTWLPAAGGLSFFFCHPLAICIFFFPVSTQSTPFALSLSLALSHFRSPRSPPFYFCLSVRPSTCVDYDTRTLIHRHRCSLRAYPLVCCSLPALPGTNDGTISQLHFCIHSAQVYAKVSWLFTLSRGGR